MFLATDKNTQHTRTRYLEHLRKRAAGEIMTTAAWLRQFVTSHPAYKKDSVVTDEIAYDLVVACQEIGLVRMIAHASGMVVRFSWRWSANR